MIASLSALGALAVPSNALAWSRFQPQGQDLMRAAVPFIQAIRRGSLVDLQNRLSRNCALTYNIASRFKEDGGVNPRGKTNVAAFLKQFRDRFIVDADTRAKPATFNFYHIRPKGWWVTAEAVGPDTNLPGLGNVPWQGQFWLSGVYEPSNLSTVSIRNVIIMGDLSNG